MELVRKNWIAEKWGIEENKGDDALNFPFVVTCDCSNGEKISFGCKSVFEAHGKLLAIADEYARQGHLVGIR